jgi:hypothetical protein
MLREFLPSKQSDSLSVDQFLAKLSSGNRELNAAITATSNQSYRSRTMRAALRLRECQTAADRFIRTVTIRR